MTPTDAIAWPFAIGGAMTERWEWLTDPLEPPYGPPQNRKLRQAPRIVLNFEGLESGDNRRWMETLLVANGAGQWHVPLVIDDGELATAASDGDIELSITTTDRRFRVGGNAMLLGPDPRQHQVVEIQAVNADSIELTAPIEGDWPAGSTLVPTIGCRLAGAPILPRFTGDIGAYAIVFKTIEPLDVDQEFGGATYRTFPVFEYDHFIDWAGDPSYQPARNLAEVDNDIGRIVVFDQAGMVLPRIAFDISVVDRASIGQYLQLLSALSGRWQPIWVPSQAQDVRITSKQSSTLIDVAWMGYADFPVRANRRDLRIEMADGEVIYRRIEDATELSASTERLELDIALPGDFAAADVVSISFMALCCQDSDTNLLRLWSRDIIESSLAFRGINNDF